MGIEKIFINESLKEVELKEYLAKKFEKAGYAYSQIQRTPLGTRIVIWVQKSGLIIGKAGRKINEIAEEIKKSFGIENPLIDVKEVENPYLDPNIVAYRIKRGVERGINYKKVCNYYLQKVMENGAVGCLIKISGKLAGVERSRKQKFKAGYILYSGNYAENFVKVGRTQAMIKPGIIGIEVRIMKNAPQELIKEKMMKEKE